MPVAVFQRRANRLTPKSILGEMCDVSTAGARIRLMAAPDLKAGASIEILCFPVEQPDSGLLEATPLRLWAHIVWCDCDRWEMGVRFDT